MREMILIDNSGEEPAPGKELTIGDVQTILDAIQRRQANFPDEPFEMCLALILLNIGDRYAKVHCIAGEWHGQKKDIPRGEGVPLCPQGHPLTQDPGLKLGWMSGL